LVKAKVWAKTGVADMGGCLCIGCLERRIGRELAPKDFMRNHPFNEMPASVRLVARRTGIPESEVARVRAEGVSPLR
jgi:hypothetical protein